MKIIWIKKYLPIPLLFFTLNFYGCQSECSVKCPVECVPINFMLTLDGENILVSPISFQIDDMRVETAPDNPDSPPLLEQNYNSFKLIVCQNVEYKLHVNDTIAIEISAKLDTVWIDKCCVYFSVNSIEFNGNDICSNQDHCGGGVFELR